MTSPLDAELITRVQRALGPALPGRIAVALSGGGDSVALLHLMLRALHGTGVQLVSATVDHGLRPEAAAEAARAGRLSQRLGVPHSVLRWHGWDRSGNLQDRARQARYRLLEDWARVEGVGMLVLGHTADDQAETLLMRLARASGPAGLSGMRPTRLQGGLILARPLLEIGRGALRDYLDRQRLTWEEDPSNLDDRFARVRARQALAGLDRLGITPEALSDVARNMARADEALGWAAFQAAGELSRIIEGCVVFEARAFTLLPQEIARRLLAGAIGWIGGLPYPPRRASLERLLRDLRRGGAGTLGGCRIFPRGRGDDTRLWVSREFSAIKDLQAPPGGLWDRRWRLEGPPPPPRARLAALGPQGRLQCPDRADSGLPAAVLEACPALWLGEEVIAAPAAGRPEGWQLRLEGGDTGFRAGLLTH
ncbi:tRNA lysidine(34) synthetase TilS [Pseudodonghicola flavimaris]|uniref:tRNA(Ile)-lysidine synthase n=1 Tax=Pseudodonghicola flavimaris TaxID=3050036 RepID=A0ABT7EXS4_9RHOB|nr:tRNA lysidine(34) synthetase TilS [Pseudodonghicola flavimaris]MDK3017146.1 tRNA lysidine(34) synthetase TilS [Pseudodonghicola flavimaris]